MRKTKNKFPIPNYQIPINMENEPKRDPSEGREDREKKYLALNALSSLEATVTDVETNVGSNNLIDLSGPSGTHHLCAPAENDREGLGTPVLQEISRATALESALNAMTAYLEYLDPKSKKSAGDLILRAKMYLADYEVTREPEGTNPVRTKLSSRKRK